MRTSSVFVVDAFTRSPRRQRPRIDTQRFVDGVRPAGATLVALSVGVVVLLFGLATAQGQRLIRYVNGEPAFGGFGTRVVGVGDLDLDGVPDVLVREMIGFGQFKELALSGADGHTLFGLTAPSGTNTGSFGAAADSAGDVDGDGVPDILVGHPGSDVVNHLGSVYVFSGADGTLIRTWQSSDAQGLFGMHVAGLGDVDGDGHSDIAAATDDYLEPSQPSIVRVFSGATGSQLARMGSGLLPSKHNWTIARAGDADGDGVPDLAISDDVIDSVRVISGASIGAGKPQTLWHAEPTIPTGSWGASLDAAGDVNGDGRDDLLVSDEQSLTQGEAHVLSGADGSLLLTLEGAAGGPAGYGRCVAGLGDANGDGTPDLAVGSSVDTSPLVSLGCVTIHSGKDGSILGTILSDAAAGWGSPDGIGETISRVGDVDGDGLADIVVGARLGNPATQPKALGRVYLFGLGGNWTWLGHSLMSSVGTSVLFGEGVTQAGQPFDIVLSNAPATAPGLLVLGLTEMVAPYPLGPLVPTPDFVVVFTTDALGTVTWDGTWPDGLAPDMQFTLQAWVPDGTSSKGWSVSSALRVRN